MKLPAEDGVTRPPPPMRTGAKTLLSWLQLIKWLMGKWFPPLMRPPPCVGVNGVDGVVGVFPLVTSTCVLKRKI